MCKLAASCALILIVASCAHMPAGGHRQHGAVAQEKFGHARHVQRWGSAQDLAVERGAPGLIGNVEDELHPHGNLMTFGLPARPAFLLGLRARL